MKRADWRQACCWGLLGALLAISVVARAGSLARYVPDDVGLCLELDGLSGSVVQILDSPLYRGALGMPPLSYLTGTADIDRIRKIAAVMSDVLGVDEQVLWQQVFGDQVVFGVWSGGLATGPDSQTGLLLVEAADPRMLAQLVAAVAYAPRSGETGTRIQQRTHAGAKYWSREGQREGRTVVVYLAAAGRVGVVTANESLLRRVLELARGGDAPEGSLAMLASYRHAQSQLSDEAPWRVFLNPRPWDSQMTPPPVPLFEQLPASAQFARQALSEIWRTTDYWAASIRIEPPLRIETRWQFERAKLPPALAGALASLDGPSASLDCVPDNAVLALAGHLDLKQLASAAHSDSTQQVQSLIRELFWGWDLTAPLLVQMRPQMVLYLEPAEADDSIGPLDWGFRIELPEPTADDPTGETVGQLLDQGLEALLEWSARAQAKGAAENPISLRSEVRDGLSLRIAELSAGERRLGSFCYCLGEEFLVGGSSPETVVRGAQAKPDQSLAASAVLGPLLDHRLAHPTHWVYLDCARLRTLLAERHQALVQMLVEQRRLDDPTALRVIGQLHGLLTSLDRVLVAVRCDATGVSLHVGAEVNEAALAKALPAE